jgi:hypothetical protein
VPAPDLFNVGRSSGLAVGQALLDHLSHVDFLDQIIPRGVLR